jgi:hypothetical protein
MTVILSILEMHKSKFGTRPVMQYIIMPTQIDDIIFTGDVAGVRIEMVRRTTLSATDINVELWKIDS